MNQHKSRERREEGNVKQRDGGREAPNKQNKQVEEKRRREGKGGREKEERGRDRKTRKLNRQAYTTRLKDLRQCLNLRCCGVQVA